VAGTPNSRVMPSSAMAENQSGRIVPRHDLHRAAKHQGGDQDRRVADYICDIGSTQYALSAGVTPRCEPTTLALNSTLRCVSITPLGLPVVPEV